MRAAHYSQRGPSSVLTVDEVDTPGPGPGEVRVRLHVAGVNPTDWKLRATGPDFAYPFQVPGQDGAGVVEAVGAGVDPGRIGERVWVYLAAHQRPWGTAAQYTVVPARRAVPLPATADFDLGAGLGVPFLTAYSCLFAEGPIDGTTVLVHGGAGAVGHAAIQLAVRGGAQVITTVSTDAKAELAAQAGAHVIVNYRTDDAAARIRAAARAGVDRVVEVALGHNIALDLAVLAPHGRIVTYASEPKAPEVPIPVRALMGGNVTLRFMLLYGEDPDFLTRGADWITEALAEEALQPLPTTRFSLERTGEAHDAVEQGAVGKVLIDLP